MREIHQRKGCGRPSCHPLRGQLLRSTIVADAILPARRQRDGEGPQGDVRRRGDAFLPGVRAAVHVVPVDHAFQELLLLVIGRVAAAQQIAVLCPDLCTVGEQECAFGGS
eukprot:6301022-Prymnesium_polylepis.1